MVRSIRAWPWEPARNRRPHVLGAAYGQGQTLGVDTTTRADLVRVDRPRPKKGSNQDWQHPHDPDAQITKMKDGRTHLAHKVIPRRWRRPWSTVVSGYQELSNTRLD